MESWPPPPEVEYARSYPPMPQRKSGAAIASLVLGILGCVPLATGLLAILFGVIGIRKTRDPYVSGKGLAIAGRILGIISVVGWSGFGGLLGYGYVESKPARVVAAQFLKDLSAGNTSGASANSSGFTAAQLQTQSQKISAFGTLQSVNIWSFNYSNFNGQFVMHLSGVAAFSSGPKPCTFDLVKQGGVYKVTSYWVQ
jgi:hypothetical protein